MLFKTEQFSYTCMILSAEDARGSIPKSVNVFLNHFQIANVRSSFFKMGTRGQ